MLWACDAKRNRSTCTFSRARASKKLEYSRREGESTTLLVTRRLSCAASDEATIDLVGPDLAAGTWGQQHERVCFKVCVSQRWHRVSSHVMARSQDPQINAPASDVEADQAGPSDVDAL